MAGAPGALGPGRAHRSGVVGALGLGDGAEQGGVVLEPGELLRGEPRHSVFGEFWEVSRSDSFAPPEKVGTLRGGLLLSATGR